MIQTLLVAVLASFLFGFGGGGWFVHRWYSVDALQAKVRFLVEDRARYKKALQLGEDIDDDHTKAEITNEEIERALRQRAAQLVPKTPTPVDLVCLDPEWVRSVGDLK